MLTVPSSPTTGWFPFARSYRSASVGSSRYAGPIFHGEVSSPPIRRRWGTIPWWARESPLPLIAGVLGVDVGEEPTVAWSYHVPCAISDRRNGHDVGQRESTLRPPASHTIVTRSFGGWAPGTSASVIGAPSIGLNAKCSSLASV